MRRRIGRKVAGIACAHLALLAGLAGCQNNPVGAALSSEEATQLPAIKVDLPPPPTFAGEDLPLAYPDGTVTVFGLRKQHEKLLGKEVKVKAYLLDVYQCPKCPKGQTCRLCDQPHFFVSDSPQGKKEKALMVVDYLTPKQKPPMLTIGKQYVIDGTFSVNSGGGFADSDGLLQFGRMLDDKGKEFLSQATQLEAQARKGEALEAAKLKHKGR